MPTHANHHSRAHYVRNARADKPTPAVPRRIRASRQANGSKHAQACPGRHEDSGRSTSWEPRSTNLGTGPTCLCDASTFAGDGLLASAPKSIPQLPCGSLACRDCRHFASHVLLISGSRATDDDDDHTRPVWVPPGADGRGCKPSPAALDASMFAGNGLLASAPKIGIADTSPTTSY